MQQPNTSILGVGVALNHSEGPVCSMTELVICDNDEACHELLDSIAEKHTKLTGIRTLYARKQADLDAWRKEAHLPEKLQPASEEEAQDLKILVGAVAIATTFGVAMGYALGNRYRNKNK